LVLSLEILKLPPPLPQAKNFVVQYSVVQFVPINFGFNLIFSPPKKFDKLVPHISKFLKNLKREGEYTMKNTLC